jgi:hypothetical protein
VELFFSILARRLRKRGESASVHLVARVMVFIADDNRTATPFRWTYDGRPSRPTNMPATNAGMY